MNVVCTLCAVCQGSTQSALTLSNVAGIFYILVSGLALSIVVSLAEYVSKKRADDVANKVSYLYYIASICPYEGCLASATQGSWPPLLYQGFLPGFGHKCPSLSGVPEFGHRSPS